MAESVPSLPTISPEQRRVAVGQFERAQQVVAKGDYDYGIQLLLTCCKIDAANLIYRRALRQVQRTKYKNNLRGSRFAFLTSARARRRMRTAKRTRDYLKVLENGEDVLCKNPWDTAAQMDMAEAADALNLHDLAVWILEQARQKNPKDTAVNRSLARLHEKRGNFVQAIQLWELVREVDPRDVEANHKAKDLAASDTIVKGQYQEAVESGGRAATPATDAAASNAAAHPRSRITKEAETLRAKIEADLTNHSNYLHLAQLHRRVDEFDQARAVLQQGLSATGNNFDLVLALADLDIEPFRRDLAIAEGKLRHNPGDEALQKIRNQLDKEVNTRELDVFRKKADRQPTDKALRFEVGVRLLRAGQIDEAIRELQALRADPRYGWKAPMYLGYCFKVRNNWRLAERNFQDALQHIPPAEQDMRKEVLFELATGAAAAGDLAQAVDWAHELANLDFNYRQIDKHLEEWQARLQET
ncbi:MAG: hypothetical protein AB7K24_03260 [Gemmataceae bacterium]